MQETAEGTAGLVPLYTVMLVAVVDEPLGCLDTETGTGNISYYWSPFFCFKVIRTVRITFAINHTLEGGSAAGTVLIHNYSHCANKYLFAECE